MIQIIRYCKTNSTGKHNHTSATRKISVTGVLPEDSGIYDPLKKIRGRQEKGGNFYDHQPSASTLGATDATLIAGDGDR